MGRRGSYYVILLHWNFIVSLTGYCKLSYRMLPLFPILLLFYLFCIYGDLQGQKCHLKCPKVYEIYFMVIWWVILYGNFWLYPLQRKIHDIWMKFFWNQKVFHLAMKEISTLKSLYKSFSIKLSADINNSSFVLHSLWKAKIFPNFSAYNSFLIF